MRSRTSIHLRVKNKTILKTREKYKAALPKNSVLVGFSKDDGRQMTWLIYRDSRHDFRWQVRAKNGKVIGASSEGYRGMHDALNSAVIFGYQASDWDDIYKDEITKITVMDRITRKSK